MRILLKRWLLVLLLTLAFLFTTACSCTDFLSGLGKPDQTNATVVPTITPKPKAVGTPFILPSKAGTAFEGEFSEDEINDLIKQEIAKEAGDYVSDIQVSITTEALIATVQVSASDLNIKFGVTVTGVPVVIEGKVYLKVTSVTLDDKLAGWTRLTAKSLVQTAIDKYSGVNGIPVDIKNVQIDEVQLRPGKLYVRGKTL
ncbi:MAG: hypothetical protein ACYCZF_07200 [Anaerolineae bacterium]